MSSCSDLRNQLAKCKRPPELLQMLAGFNGVTEQDYEQLRQEFEHVTPDLVSKHADQLKQLVRELDYDGDLYLSHITSPEELCEFNGFVFPRIIRGDLNLSGLTSAESLVLPEEITGDLNLGLYYAQDLHLPKKIGGDLYLPHLYSAKDLVLPDEIGGSLFLNHLSNVNELILTNKIGGKIHLPNSFQGSLDKQVRQRYRFSNPIWNL